MAQSKDKGKNSPTEEAIGKTLLTSLDDPETLKRMTNIMADRVAMDMAYALAPKVKTIASKFASSEKFNTFIEKRILKTVGEAMDVLVEDSEMLDGLKESISDAVEDYDFCDLSKLLEKKLVNAINKLNLSI